MAIYHLSVSNVSRASGSKATATLSYISGRRVHDERRGETYDYGRKERVLRVGTLLPEGAPAEYADPAVLFNAVELAEFADLKSKYAKEFYRRAKQYRSSGIWKISRDEFCRLLSVPKSTAEQVRDLNKRVLKPIIEECGPLLGLKIERQYVKRRLSGFVFTFARETPPVIDARPVEARKAEDAGHWTSVAGYGEVFTTTELFDVTAARDHFDGTVEAGECRFCAFDARNREHHAQNAGKLF